MNRRSLVALPGIAALAVTSRAFAQAGTTGAPHLSAKKFAKLAGAKSAYKVPASATKQSKYLGSLTALLSLTPAQQQLAQTIFASAGANKLSLKASLKAARNALAAAVQNNDTGGISQASTALGVLKGQLAANGALANAAFIQILTPDQQAKLAQFQG